MKVLLVTVLVAVLLNLVLPRLVKMFGPKHSDKLPKGMVGEVVNMLIHHAHTPVSSSLIIALIVGLSVYFGKMAAKML